MRDIALHILRKLLVAIALLVACAAYTVAAFADTGSSLSGDGSVGVGAGQKSAEAVQRPSTQSNSVVPSTAIPNTAASTPTRSSPQSASSQRAVTETLPLGKRAAPTTQANAQSEKPLAPSSIGRTVLALGAVLALIGVFAVAVSVIRRKAQQSGKWPLLSALNLAGAPSPSGVLEILAKFPVGSGTSLLLLKLDRRVLLISQSANKGFRSGSTLSTLCELTEPADVASLLMKIRGEEQSRLAAKFESILAREEEITDQALSDVEAGHEPAASPRSARHATLRGANVTKPRPSATLAIPADAQTPPVSIGATHTGREALTAIQARMGKPVQGKQTAVSREQSRSRAAMVPEVPQVQVQREGGRTRSVLNANGAGGLLA